MDRNVRPPDNPAAHISRMRADPAAPVQPSVSIEVDDVDPHKHLLDALV